MKMRFEFVEFIPDQLETGVLYISIDFATAAHKCACGCGTEVITPLGPTDWSLIFDGVSVSLDPSIGNWSFPCRSHYWIKRNNIRWAPQWSVERVNRIRSYDQDQKEHYYQQPKDEVQSEEKRATTESWLNQIRKFFG